MLMRSCCTLVLLAAAAAGLALPVNDSVRDKKYFSLEELMAGNKFAQQNFNGTWISESEFTYSIKNTEGIFIFDVKAIKAKLFISKEVLNYLNTTNVAVSPDKRFILARSDPLAGFRYSTQARYALHDLEKNETILLNGHQRLQYCGFGGKNHSVAYVFENNVYYVDDALKSPKELQLTADGVPGVIYNGVPDWVYEEEVFGSGSALWFSTDGSHMAIASFNDTEVDIAMYFSYGTPGSIQNQYPNIWDLRYPKAGRTNPVVALRVINLKEANAPWVTLKAPVEDVGSDHILGTVTWASGDEVVAMWLNRRQNKSVLVICDMDKSGCTKELTRSEPAGWVDVTTPLFSSKRGGPWLDVEPVAQGPNGGNEWFHVVQHSRGRAEAPQAVSSGARTVTSIAGWNQEENLVYYLSTSEGEPWRRNVHVGGVKDSCLSCDAPVSCRYAGASVSPGGKYIALSCQSPDSPVEVLLYGGKENNLIISWQDNGELRSSIREYWQPQQKNLRVPVPGGFEAAVKLFIPPQLDLNDPEGSYPMVVNIYTGPNSARVLDTFGLSYQTYMSTNRSVIYCFLEGRGSGLKGKDMLFTINNNMGTVEIEDVINVTRYLTDKYSWIDKTKVGLWGWSYGGYATAMALTKDESHVFKCGVSVAPVTSWLYYDSIYTERYMGMPSLEDNALGYALGDVNFRAELLRGRRFLLMHGNADDNVHYQNAMALARSLQEADISFEQMSYPDEAHGLSGVTKHVYHTIDDFWTRCFSSSSNSTGSW